MSPILLTAEDCIPALTWPGAVEALQQGHRLPRPQQGDLLLGTEDGRSLSRAA